MRIAISFSLLYLVVALPAIIYALHEVQIFFEGTYLEQMRTAGRATAALFPYMSQADHQELVEEISEIASSNVFLYSEKGELLAWYNREEFPDTNSVLRLPITKSGEHSLAHEFVMVGTRRYLKVQSLLDGGDRLLLVRSLSEVSMLIVRMREVIIWGSLLALLAMIAVAFQVSANISRPLERLTAFARKVKDGPLPDKTDIKSPDEVGELADILNALLDRLEKQREKPA